MVNFWHQAWNVFKFNKIKFALHLLRKSYSGLHSSRINTVKLSRINIVKYTANIVVDIVRFYMISQVLIIRCYLCIYKHIINYSRTRAGQWSGDSGDVDVMGVMGVMDRKQGMMGRVWCERRRREPGQESDGGMGAGGQGGGRGISAGQCWWQWKRAEMEWALSWDGLVTPQIPIYIRELRVLDNVLIYPDNIIDNILW